MFSYPTSKPFTGLVLYVVRDGVHVRHVTIPLDALNRSYAVQESADRFLVPALAALRE